MRKITDKIGCNESTIRRELRRGKVIQLSTELIKYKSYSAEIAQQNYDYQSSNKSPNLQISNDYEFVKYVEYKILENKYSPDAVIMELERTNFCHPETGHWEMDCIEGPKGKGDSCLLTMVDRKLRKTLIFKLPSQIQDSVIKVLDKIERKMGRIKFAKMFKTITVDNGSEVLNYQKMERSLRSNKKK